MPNDVITLAYLARELARTLTGGKITKISEPECDELLFSIRKEQNLLLTVCAEPNFPRVNITTRKKDNPYHCPPFCMHLRRHITNAIIKDVYLFNSDRIICFELSTKNELYIEQNYRLYIELMGRYSNVILTNDDVITDCLRHIIPGESQRRCIMPRQQYLPPDNNRTSVFDKEGLVNALSAPIEQNLLEHIKTQIGAMSKSTYMEVLYQAKLDRAQNSISKDEIQRLADVIYNLATQKQCSSVLLYEDGIEKDYFIKEYESIEGEYKRFETLSTAIDIYYCERDNGIRIKEKLKNIAKSLRNAIKKAEKGIAVCQEKLKSCADYQKQQLFGELLIANLYRIKKGDQSVSVLNYYDQTTITIVLDINKTPQQNAEAYFKSYRKQKKTMESYAVQLKQYEANLQYLNSVQYAIEQIKSIDELAELEAEFVELGIIKAKTNKGAPKKERPSVIREYRCGGFSIMTGKNNLQNDRITFNEAKPNDMWLHVKQASGSHTLIKTEGRELPQEVLLVACEIAAFFSSQRQSPKVQIDYTYRKNVSRHPNKKLGMVNYTDYKSMTVQPQEHKELVKE